MFQTTPYLIKHLPRANSVLLGAYILFAVGLPPLCCGQRSGLLRGYRKNKALKNLGEWPAFGVQSFEVKVACIFA